MTNRTLERFEVHGERRVYQRGCALYFHRAVLDAVHMVQPITMTMTSAQTASMPAEPSLELPDSFAVTLLEELVRLGYKVGGAHTDENAVGAHNRTLVQQLLNMQAQLKAKDTQIAALHGMLADAMGNNNV